MKTEQKSITPSDAGLSLNVISGPRGHLADKWQAIEYTCELVNARRQVIWTGSYKLGIGHVKIANYKPSFSVHTMMRLSSDEESMLQAWQRKPHAEFTNKQLQADAAAKLAKFQKVAPKLDDVCHSLLSDGSAFFDGLRFEDWAAELGYDSDSIKAKETFEACDKIGRDLSRGLSRDEINGLREWANNY